LFNYGNFSNDISCEYSENGVLNKRTVKHEWEDEVSCICFYDENGKIIKMKNKKMFFRFQVGNSLVEEPKISKTYFKRNNLGLIKEKFYDKADSNETKEIIIADYDFKNNEVIIKSFYPDSYSTEIVKNLKYKFFETDNHKFCVEVIDDSGNITDVFLGDYQVFYQKNIYNPELNLIKSHLYCTNYHKKGFSKNNKCKSCLEILRTKSNSEYIDENYYYQYDKNGNWIKRQFFVNGKKCKEWERKIYYC